MDLRMYFLVNSDLNMGVGKTAAQVGHAVQLAVEYATRKQIPSEFRPDNLTARYFFTREHDKYEDYLNGQIKKIVLTATEEEMLNYASAYATIQIRDAGYTEVAPNSLTAMYCGIWGKDEIPADHPLRGFKLLR